MSSSSENDSTQESPLSRYRNWIAFGLAVGLCSAVGVVVFAAYVNSEKVKAISIRYVGEGAEINDPKIPFRDDHLPDYKLRVQCDKPGFWIFNGTTYTLGPIPNQSAAEGLEFAMAGDIPSDKIQQITLIEDDGFDDDPVCSVQASADKLSAKGYDFQVVTDRSWRFGFERVWEGKLGATAAALFICMAAMFVQCLFEGGVSAIFNSLRTNEGKQ